MSEQLDVKDKIILSPDDSEGFAEHFSRMSPGDEVEFKGKATLDEAGQKTITLSISEFEVVGGDKPPGDEPDGDEESAAVKVLKNEEGVPEQEGNTPPDTLPAA